MVVKNKILQLSFVYVALLSFGGEGNFLSLPMPHIKPSLYTKIMHTPRHATMPAFQPTHRPALLLANLHFLY